MFHHLLKLIWKRKTRNLMLSLEILIAFVIVFAIAAFGMRNYQLYLLPTGVNYRDVWTVNAQTQDTKADAAVFEQFRRALVAMPEVEAVAFVGFPPYTPSSRSLGFRNTNGNRDFDSEMMEASDDFYAVSDLKLDEGRWFSAVDDGATDTPVVINRLGAKAWFPGQSPIGKMIIDGEGKTRETRYRVIGVIEDYRSRGEFTKPGNLTFTRLKPGPAGGPMKSMLLKLRPGTPRLFELRLSQQLKQVRAEWNYEIAPVAELRRARLRSELTPLAIVSVVAAFLLLMVGVGLFGVLWQNTSRRIPEIGLRRAVGASAGHIYRQIVAEQMLLSTAAMTLALLLLVQLPLTGTFGERLNWSVFIAAALMSMMVIYLLSLLCSLYPGWRASRLNPTQALHYE